MIESYLKSLLRVLAIGAGFASIPLIASFAALQPPWPPAIGPVSAGLILLATLIVWEWTRRSRSSVRRGWILAATFLTLAGLIGYLFLYSLFVEPIPGSDVRVVRGYECTADAKLVYPRDCPDLPRDALRDAEWEAVRLWTRASVTNVRLGLSLSWLLFVAGLIAAVGSVVAGRKVR